MRHLVFALCLIASVWSFHLNQHHDFNVKVKTVEIVNHPGAKVKIDHFEPLAELVEAKEKEPKIKPNPRITSATLNDFGDQIFSTLQTAITENGLDPLELPDIHETFEFTLIITYEGTLDLTNGWLSDISTLHRGADLIVTYDPELKFLEITLPIHFEDLLFTIDYRVDIMGLTPSGIIDGKVMDIELEAKIGFRAEEIAFALDSFDIPHAGSIEVNFSGDVLLDWLLNLLSDIVMTLLHDVVLDLVGGFVSDGLVTLVDTINQLIDGFLNPTTPAPVPTTAIPYFIR